MKKQPCTSTPSSPLAVHKDSQSISKEGKPKIRIIHIFAPEIIKTDVANFRELVQRLTGKPTTEKGSEKKRPRRIRKERDRQNSSPILCDKSNKKAVEVRNNGLGSSNLGFRSSNFLGGSRERVIIKEEEEEMMGWNNNNIINGANSLGGFLGGFGDLDVGFIQELGGGVGGGEFPLILPVDTNYYHGFEDTL